MYLVFTLILAALKYALIFCTRKGPMAASLGLPPASVSPVAASHTVSTWRKNGETLSTAARSRRRARKRTRKQVLPSALREHNNSVPLALQHALQVTEDAMRPVQHDLDLHTRARQAGRVREAVGGAD